MRGLGGGDGGSFSALAAARRGLEQRQPGLGPPRAAGDKPPAPPRPAPQQLSTPLINPESFREDFSVDAFLVRLTQDVMVAKQPAPAGSAGGRPVSSEESAAATIDRVQALLRRFIQAEYEIAALGNDVTARLAELQQSAAADEGQYKAEVRTLERVSERIKEGIREIDGRVSHISQTATRVGDRLQTAEALRVRCLEAQELISHLQAFSCHSAGEDFSKLPPLFTNDATLAEAAAVSRRLMLLATEAAAAKQRTKATGAAAAPGGGIGSVEHTLKVLESYCNWLENRVVSRFDVGVSEGNADLQAASVAIMVELDKEKAIAQRWVASRPMFLALSPEMVDDWLRRANRPPPPGAAADADAGGPEHDIVARQSRAISNLFKDMHASFKDDVAVAAAVFQKPEVVLEMFVGRLLEQNVMAALERLLLPGGLGMAALAAATSAAAAGGGGGGTPTSPPAGSPSMRGGGGGGGGGLGAAASFKDRATSFAASIGSSAASAAAAAAAAAGGGGASSGSATAAGAGAGAAAGGGAAGLPGAVGQPPPPGGAGPPPAALQRQQLRLLAEAYAKTRRLAQNLERAVRPVAAVDVASIAEGLWPPLVGPYPAQELAWLQAAFQEEVARQESPELSLDFVRSLLSWNEEATGRALMLSPAGQAAHNCRLLFHHLVPPPGGAGGAGGGGGAGGEGGGGGGGGGGGAPGGAGAGTAAAHPGCLLEQLARHILGGVDYSLELCSAGGAGGIGSLLKLGLAAVSSAASHQVAAEFVSGKVRKPLEAAHAATEVMLALQEHYSRVVVPAVSGSVAELSAASSALLSLMRAAEGSITAVLRKSVDTFIAQMERVLTSEQRRSDFVPRDDALSFDRPTTACLLGTGLLSALASAAADTLSGDNRKHLLTEVARRSYQLLLQHMTRFTYSPTGALKWKKDVNEYAEVLAQFGVPSANEDMAHLQQLVNVLVVAPESLLGLVDGSLRMSHREALRFIALREDFKAAKVEGKSLLQLFSGEGMEGQFGHHA